jgi:hypothetical protein
LLVTNDMLAFVAEAVWYLENEARLFYELE